MNTHKSNSPSTSPKITQIDELPKLIYWRNDFLTAKSASWATVTKQCYTSVIDLYIEYVSEHYGPDHWPPSRYDILAWLEDVRSRNTDTTAATYWKHIRTWLNYLEIIGETSCETNPVHIIKKLKLQPREPTELEYVAFTQEELDILFGHLNENSDTLIGCRDLALLKFQYHSGCRSGEVARLKIDELDLEDETPSALIRARNSKTGKYRHVYFNKNVAKELKRWLKSLSDASYQGAYVFPSLRYGRPGGKMSVDSINHMLQRRLKEAGLPHKKAHALRHSHAEHGVDKVGIKRVQRQLGHSDLRTTARYLRGKDPDRAEAYMKWA